MSSQFSMRIDTLDHQSALLIVNGDLDLATAPEFKRRLLTAIHDGKSTVIIDLTDCTFLDSTGLNVLLHAGAEPDVRSLELVIPTSSLIRRVFAISHLDQMFEIHATRDTALAARDQEAHPTTTESSTPLEHAPESQHDRNPSEPSEPDRVRRGP